MGASRTETTPRRVLTVPNLITLARLGVLVWFLFALLRQHERVFATGLLAIAGTTDFLDGYVARRFNQVSTLGKVLDPAVDRVLLLCALGAMIATNAVPLWLGVLVICREAAVSVAMLALAALGAGRIDVLVLGKAGTFGLMVGLPLLLLGAGPGTVAHAVRILGWLVTYPALVLAIVAAFSYLKPARAALSARGARAR